MCQRDAEGEVRRLAGGHVGGGTEGTAPVVTGRGEWGRAVFI